MTESGGGPIGDFPTENSVRDVHDVIAARGRALARKFEKGRRWERENRARARGEGPGRRSGKGEGGRSRTDRSRADGSVRHPRPERTRDENVQQEKGRQPEQRDHPRERALPTVPGEGGGDGADLRRRDRADAAADTLLRQHRGGSGSGGGRRRRRRVDPRPAIIGGRERLSLIEK